MKRPIENADELLQALKDCRRELNHWHQYANMTREGYVGSDGSSVCAGVLNRSDMAIANAEQAPLTRQNLHGVIQ